MASRPSWNFSQVVLLSPRHFAGLVSRCMLLIFSGDLVVISFIKMFLERYVPLFPEESSHLSILECLVSHGLGLESMIA